MATDRLQTKGRKANAAEPLGSRPGLVSDKDAVKTGEAERKSAGPDGSSAAAVGDMAKRRP